VVGKALGVEPGIGGGLLDEPGDGLVGQALAGDPAGLGDGAEQRAFGPGEGAGESRSGASRRNPSQVSGAAAGQKPGRSGSPRPRRWP